MAQRDATASQTVEIDATEDEAAGQFRATLQAGTDWFAALLEAIAAWRTPVEVFQGQRQRYLLGGGEAFDWLLLAERLVAGANGLLPEDEVEELVLHGRLPRPLSDAEFREAIGEAKHQAVMNFWYGVRVEEALGLAVEHEVRKARRGLGQEDNHLDDTVYRRIYGSTRTELLEKFFAPSGQPAPAQISLNELNEFTYSLFKHRLDNSDKARIASDTKKALLFLNQLGKGRD